TIYRTSHSQHTISIWLAEKVKALIRDPKKLLRRLKYLSKQNLDKFGGTRDSQKQVEEQLFSEEVEQLRKYKIVDPIVVSDPNSKDVVELVRSLDPYLILTLGGPIYRKPLLDCARGLALNQHDGWCPTYKGANTVDWTLYHRDITHCGNTVHVLTSGVDAGPILRRSTVCLIKGDTRESCFARVVALGTELMCEAVAEIINSEEITLYDQPSEQGFSYLNSHLNNEVIQIVECDLRNGLIPLEKSRLQKF
ncbi:formyl transferase, partial [Thermodesulfobacteriota bacterium]